MISWALPSCVLAAIAWSIIMWFVTTFVVIDNMMTGWDVLEGTLSKRNKTTTEVRGIMHASTKQHTAHEDILTPGK